MFPVPFKLKDEIKFIGIKWPKMLKCHVLVSLHAPASFLPSYLHEIAYQAAVQKASWKCLVLFSVFQQNSMEKQWPIITSIRLPQMFSLLYEYTRFKSNLEGIEDICFGTTLANNAKFHIVFVQIWVRFYKITVFKFSET